MTTPAAKTILVYDLKSGNAFLTDSTADKPGELFVPLGEHSTLPGAVGEARRLGHRVDGWMSLQSQVVLDVNAIRTPFDHAVK